MIWRFRGVDPAERAHWLRLWREANGEEAPWWSSARDPLALYVIGGLYMLLTGLLLLL